MTPRAGAAAVALTAVVTFLALSDETFSVRVAGLNVRFAQAVLAPFLAEAAVRAARTGLRDLPMPRGAALGLAAFCASALVTASAAEHAAPALLRASWFAFNFAGSLAFAAWAARRDALARGLAIGVAGIACVVWIDAVAIHWAGAGPLLGGGQSSYLFDGRELLRPCAFHYEPSYAAGALCLGLAATFHPSAFPPRVAVAASAVVVSAVALTSSRAGFLVLAGLLVAAGAVLPFVRGARPLAARVAAAYVAAALLVAAFALQWGGARYLRLVAGPLGPARTWERLSQVAEGPVGGLGGRLDRHTSERDAPMSADDAIRRGTGEIDRLASYRRGLAEWREAPWFGRGPSFHGHPGRRMLAQGSMSAWIALLREFGAVGAAAVLAAWGALWRGSRVLASPGGALVAVVLVLHAGVTMALGPSFVRLDFALLAAGTIVACAAAAAPRTGEGAR